VKQETKNRIKFRVGFLGF